VNFSLSVHILMIFLKNIFVISKFVFNKITERNNGPKIYIHLFILSGVLKSRNAYLIKID
jgi:hypothetical protein